MEKSHTTIIVAVLAVIAVAIVGYIATREKYAVDITTPASIPAGYSKEAVQMIKQVQNMPAAMFYINEDGFDQLSSPTNLIKTVNAVSNIQLALGATVAPSFQMNIPPSMSIPSEYNGVLVLILPGSKEPLVFPFGKTLPSIANDMENLYLRIPSNRVPFDLNLQQMENSMF
jgi:hypothetical protein